MKPKRAAALAWQPLQVSRSPALRPRLILAPDSGTGAQARKLPAPRILIVEDDFLVATEMEVALSDAGFAIAGVAASGENAIALATRQDPDLAVVDIRLAGDGDGVDTALELSRVHGVHCIFATAHSDPDTRARAQAAASLGWLQKPYTMASGAGSPRRAPQVVRHGSLSGLAAALPRRGAVPYGPQPHAVEI